QLETRWSARYASVFADDPGTAVCTVTATGMAARSRRRDSDPQASVECGPVVLWKDQAGGARVFKPMEDQNTFMLTATAQSHVEYSADGRSDHGTTYGLQFEGIRSLFLTAPEGDERARDGHPAPADERWLASWTDIRELSAGTYALNAAIELRGKQ